MGRGVRWGPVALPGPQYDFLAYILGPMLGAPLGAVVYDFLLRPGMPAKNTVSEVELIGGGQALL